MTRSKRFVTSLVSSYAAIGVTVIYTIASVPMALHYLDKEQFGLWALVTQLSAYLMLLEFGMTGSVARSLSDHKDHVENGNYGNILCTGGRVFAIQGFFVVLIGWILAWFGPPLFNLSSRLQNPFVILMAIQAVLSGAKMATGSVSSPLWCHQRLDLSNLASSLSTAASFGILWLGFKLGWQIYSLAFATAVGFVVSLAVTYISCRRLGFYPPRAHRGSFDPLLFRQLFHFGGGLFLMNLGAQLASASQIIVVSRLLGMEAATTWSITTKIFNMAQQFVARVLDSSAGGLAEMVVRGENDQLQKRFRDLITISAVLAVAASAGIALINGPFVEVWTSGRVTWKPWNNLLLACVLFSTTITRCHTSLVGITKHIRGMKFIYLAEGFTFVALSVLVVRGMGFTGMLYAALICNIGITGTYGIIRTADYFEISRLGTAGWVIRPAGILALTMILFALSRIPELAGLDAPYRLGIGIATFCMVVIPSLWFFGVSRKFHLEMRHLLGSLFQKAKSKLRMA